MFGILGPLQYSAGDHRQAKKQSTPTDKFAGALDALFASQRERLPDEAAQNDAQKEKDTAAKKKEEEEAQQAKEAAAQKEAAEKAAKEKKALEAKQAMDADAKNRENTAQLKRLIEDMSGQAGAAGSDPKRLRANDEQIIKTLSVSNCSVVLVGKKLVLKNPADTNKKVATDTVLAAWSSGSSLVASGSSPEFETGFEYKMSFQTNVVEAATKKRMRLDKLIQERGWATGEIFVYEIFGYESYVTKKKNTPYVWMYTGEDRKLVVSVLEAARNTTTTQLLWQVQFNTKKQRIEPTGLAVVLSKATQVPGGGQLELS